MDCPKGGFSSKCTNVNLMTEVCDGAAVEVQSLMTKHGQTSVPKGLGVVVAKGHFLICNSTAQSNCNSSLEAVYRSQERGKRRQYEERIRKVDMSSVMKDIRHAEVLM